MPGMADPYFSKTLTLICEHSERGAIGLVVNKPIDVTLGSLFEQVNIELTDEALRMEPVHFGGPVMVDRGFVLHQPLGEWNSTLKLDDDTGLTTSKDILEAMANAQGPVRALVTLGYAGWAPGQLEDEIKRNGWLTVEAKAALIFDLPSEARVTAAMAIALDLVFKLAGCPACIAQCHQGAHGTLCICHRFEYVFGCRKPGVIVELQGGIPVTKRLMQYEAAINHHRPAEMDGFHSQRFVVEFDVDLLEQTAERDVDGFVDHQADRTALRMLADQRQGPGKIRVGHAGHGDQEMIGKIDAIHKTKFYLFSARLTMAPQ